MNTLFPHEIIELTSQGEARCDEILKLLTLRRNVCEMVRSRLQCDREYFENITEADHRMYCDDVIDQLDKIAVDARKLADKMYAYSDQPICAELSGDYEEQEKYIYDTVDLPVDMIIAQIEPGAMYIRTPLLFSRNHEKSESPLARKGIQAYADAVNRAIEQADGYKDLDRDRLRTKTIFYLFVLDGKARMIDNDNYDTTAVTNSIAGHLYGGDSPLTCRMVYDSVLSAELPAGTYITVLPASEPLPEKADIVARWKTILEK